MHALRALVSSLLVAVPAWAQSLPPAANAGRDSGAGAPGQPIVSGINKTHAALSERIEIRGAGFGPGGATSAVLVAGTAAWTSTWTDSRIVAYVPEGAPLGPTTVLVAVKGVLSNPTALEYRTSKPV
jgi:hypothetical protein